MNKYPNSLPPPDDVRRSLYSSESEWLNSSERVSLSLPPQYGVSDTLGSGLRRANDRFYLKFGLGGGIYDHDKQESGNFKLDNRFLNKPLVGPSDTELTHYAIVHYLPNGYHMGLFTMYYDVYPDNVSALCKLNRFFMWMSSPETPSAPCLLE